MGEGDEKSQPITFSRIQEIAFGWLKMSRNEFYDSTWSEFTARLNGYLETKEQEQREHWDAVRITINAIWHTVAWKDKKIPDVKKLYPMPWDKKQVSKDNPERQRLAGLLMAHRTGMKLKPAHLAALKAAGMVK